LGIGDWGLGIWDWAQSPIPNPQSPIPKYIHLILTIIFIINFIISIIIYLYIAIEMPHLFKTHPRTYGADSRCCRLCRNTHAMVNKYSLNLCRKCFREQAPLIGFIKYK